MPSDYQDVLSELAKLDGACLYWQMTDPARGLAALKAGAVKEVDDLLIHPSANEIERGIAYAMPDA